MNLLIKCEHPALMPVRAHASDAGADLKSVENAIIQPWQTKMLDTGVAVKIPTGFVGMVFNRSSQGKRGITIPNSVGIIDSDYRGNIKVLLTNNSNEDYEIIALNTKIAQLVVVPITLPHFEKWDGASKWDDTARGTGGFGSTGV